MPDVNAFLNFYDVQSPKRAFYGSGQKDDYLGYVDTGIQSTKELDYLDYAGNEMKSSGLFNADGVITKAKKKRLREKLRKTESCIWDLVISFATEYGVQFNSEGNAFCFTFIVKREFNFIVIEINHG